MAWPTQSQDALRTVLAGVRTIAIIGLSADPARPSHEVCVFLTRRGYTCLGVNPRLAGSFVAAVNVVATLAEADRPIDMVDVFRASEALPEIVAEVLRMRPNPTVLWTQFDVVDEASGACAARAGLTVVMNACPKIVLSGGGGRA